MQKSTRSSRRYSSLFKIAPHKIWNKSTQRNILHLSSSASPWFISSRLNPGRREKIKLNFHFHTSLWCLKRFYEMHGPGRVNRIHALIIQCLFMIDCLIRVEGLYVLNNKLCWILLCTVICMYKDLFLPQPSSASVNFFPWLNQWLGILKTDYQNRVIDLSIFRNQAHSYSIFEPNISVRLPSCCFDFWRLKKRDTFGNFVECETLADDFRVSKAILFKFSRITVSCVY